MTGAHEGTSSTLGAGFARVRKAVAAGVVAGVGGAVTALIAAVQEPSAGGTAVTGDELHGIILAGVSVALTAGYAAWQTKNAPPAQEETTAGYPDVQKTEPPDALL